MHIAPYRPASDHVNRSAGPQPAATETDDSDDDRDVARHVLTAWRLHVA